MRRIEILAASIAIVVLPAVGVAGDSSEPFSALQGIRTGLSRGHGEYVAAIVEVVAAQKCSTATDTSTCSTDSKVVEVLASHGREFKPGDMLAFLNSGGVGSRYLVFLVPLAGQSNMYGATFLSLSVSESDRRSFVADLRQSGL